MIALVDRWIAALAVWGYFILGGAAAVEYVVPPFPGDTVTLIGGVYVARGQRSAVLTLLALTVGSVVGAAIDYAIGRGLGRRLDAADASGRLWGMPVARLREVQGQMQRRGTWLLLLNRFMPGVRAFVFYAAGAARLSLARVILLGALSAAVFNGLVLAAGIALGGNLEELQGWLGRYQLAVWGLLLLASLALVVRLVARRKAAGP